MSDLERAIRLRELNRPEEAVAMLMQHLAQEPEDAFAHEQLAWTRYGMDGQGKAALESVNKAIGLEPENPDLFGLKSLILTKLDRDAEGLVAAEQAIALDADSSFGWAAKASALGGMRQWAKAEEACRHALSLDPDDDFALNQLSIFLRMQGKTGDSAHEARNRLARAAEDPVAHANSGWVALQTNQLKAAEEHFREALRLDPTMEYARLGLRESYRARSVVYRLFLKWVFFMQKFSEKQQWLIIFGLLVGVRVGRTLLNEVDPRLAAALGIVYAVLAFGMFLAPGIGSFLMLKDKMARLALTTPEKLEGVFVGGGCVLGLVLVGLTFVGLPKAFLALGLTLLLAGVPGSQFWDNDSRSGKVVFGILMAIVYGVGLSFFVSLFGFGKVAEISTILLPLGILAVIGTSWLTLVPSLTRNKGE